MKRLISGLLISTMIISLLGTTVLAEDGLNVYDSETELEVEESEEYETAIETEIMEIEEITETETVPETEAFSETEEQFEEETKDAYSGVSGNLTWSINSGTLTISGNGPMADFSSRSNAPWYSYRSSISKVIIESGVTSVGSCAFDFYQSIQSVTIPNTVKKIGDNAFNWCSKLASITIPSSVELIGNNAFERCESLTSISIPTGVKHIGDSAFSRCSGLTSITLPKGVEKLGNSAFEYCPNLTTVSIGEGLKELGNSVFYDCNNLTNVTLPKSLESISNSAFYYCSSLTEITIPDNVKTIKGSAFAYCTNLSNVVIPENTTTIGYSAFSNCDSLTKITLLPFVKTIESNAIPKNCTIRCLKGSEADSYAKRYGNNVEYFGVIDSGVSGNINWAFMEDGTLVLSGSGNMPYYSYASYVPWYKYNTKIKNVIIEPGITSIGYNAFNYCTNLKSVKMTDDITVINDYAFYNCINLQDINLSKNIERIGNYAFSYCGLLKDIELSNKLSLIGSYAFFNCNSIENIELGNNLKSIASYAFKGCTSLDLLEVPSTVERIGTEAIPSECKIKCKIASSAYDYAVKNGNTVVDDDFIARGNCGENAQWILYEDQTLLIYGNGNMYDYDNDNNQAPWIKYKSRIHDLIVDDGISNIGNWAFGEHYYYLYNVSIPASIKTIGSHAFDNCALEEIKLNEGLLSIGEGAFQYCDYLKISDFPASLNTIGERAFKRCGGLKLNSLNNVKQVGAEAFSECNGLTSMHFSSSLQVLGERAFQSCVSLREVSFDRNIEDIGKEAFSGCDWLKKIIFPSYTKLTSIPEGFCKGCTALNIIQLPDNLKIIGKQAFSGCRSLKNIELPNDLTTIKTEAFWDCASLNSLNIPSKLSTIESRAFYYTAIRNVIVPYSVYNLGDDHPFGYYTTITGYDDSAAYTCANNNYYQFVSLGNYTKNHKIEEFVTRLYNVCLKRNPDHLGLADWVNNLSAGKITGIQAAYGFIFSEEFKNKNLCNNDFVEYLYMAFMGRGSDSAGKNDWVSKLESGTTREAVFNGFAGSQEFKSLCQSYGIVLGNIIAVPKEGTTPRGNCSVCGAEDGVTAFVIRLYDICLGRYPDSSGLKDWCTQLWTHKSSGSTVAFGFIFSNEFTGKNFNNTEYVKRLYRAFFGREADPAGLNDWVSQLNRGATRKHVFDGFTGSQEFNNLCKRYGITR